MFFKYKIYKISIFPILFLFQVLHLWAAISYSQEGVFKLIPVGIENLSSQEKEKVSEFLKEVELTLPQSFKQKLNNSMSIQFSKDLTSLEELVKPNCELNAIYPEKELENYKQGKDHLKHNLLGKFDEKKGISLNYNFLSKIIWPDKFSKDYNCEHQNFYKLAKATLIHELSHAYDMRNIENERSGRIDKLEKCLAYKKKYFIYPTDACEQRAREGKRFVSDLIQYRHLSGWTDKGLFFPSSSLSHYEVKRSPLPYEYMNRMEHFPVNMEFFLLDPEYQCRRPTLYSFFSKYFNHIPFPNFQCQVNTYLDLNNIIDRVLTHIDLRVSRVHSIHYLYATSGKKISERFGTGMYRVVLCDRSDHNMQDCVKNADNDIVFTYQKTDHNLIKVDIQSMMDVTYQYNDMEFRDLYSLPIKMDDLEKKIFIYQLISDYWEYTGKYYLGGGTVATELIRPLKGSILNYNLYSKHPLSPKGLYRDLVDSRIVERSVFFDVNRPEQNGYIFISSETRFNEMFNRLKKHSGKSRFMNNFKNYTEKSSVKERKANFEGLKFKNQSERYSYLNDFNILEDFINMKNSYQENYYLKATKRDEHQHYQLNKVDYGIPLK